MPQLRVRLAASLRSNRSPGRLERSTQCAPSHHGMENFESLTSTSRSRLRARRWSRCWPAASAAPICTSSGSARTSSRGSMESGNARFAPDLSRDIIMGHEFCVEVVEYGPNTTGPVGIGERTTSVPSRGAYSNDYPGGYSEYMVLGCSPCCCRSPTASRNRARRDDRADGGRHARRARRTTERRRADGRLRLRTGRSGHNREPAQRGRGDMIIASDFSPRRRELAGIMGADVVVDPRETPPMARRSNSAATRRATRS